MSKTTNVGPTPGPWASGWIGTVGEPGLGRPCVGTVGAADWVGPEGAEADARLIAAAPDLLAALREVADAHEALLREYGKPWGWGRLPVETARSAIARAEGRIA